MPNGESKNWIRFTITLESFYSLYGNWPSKMHLYPFFVMELQDKLSSKDFLILQSKLTLIEDKDNPFLAFDENGNRFDYSSEGTPPLADDSIKAVDWLGINKPDYID